MAVDLSALDGLKTKEAKDYSDVRNVDLSALGIGWETDTPQTAERPDLPGDVIRAPRPSDTSVIPYEPPKESFIRRVFDYFAGTSKEGQTLFGHGDEGVSREDETIASEVREKGIIGFWYDNLAKSNQDKVDDRVEKLVEVGVDKDRAYEISYQQVHGEDVNLSPRERKAMNNVRNWELAGKGVDLLDFVPFGIIGKAVIKGGAKTFKYLSKTTDVIKIAKKLDEAAPFLDDASKIRAVKLIAKTDDVVQVQKIIGDATKATAAAQDAATVAGKAIPKVADAGTVGKITGAAKAAVKSSPFAGAARRVASNVTELSKAARAKFAKTIKASKKETDEAVESTYTMWRSEEAHPVTGAHLGEVKTEGRFGFTEEGYERAVKNYGSTMGPGFKKETVTFTKPLIISEKSMPADKSVDPSTYLYKKWFGDRPLKYDAVTDRFDKDAMVAREAVRLGFDGIVYGGREIQDLRKLVSKTVAKTDAAKAAKKTKAQKAKDKMARTNIVENTTPIKVGDKTVKTLTDVDPAVKVKVPDEATKPIDDLAKREQVTLNPVRAAGTYVAKGRNVATEMEGNLAKFNNKISDPDVVKLREELLLGPENILEIITRKRGIVTNAMSVQRAKFIKGTLEDVSNLPKGTVATAEQITAIGQIVREAEKVNIRLRTLIDNGGMAATKAERELIAKLGDDFAKMSDHEILNRALAENTIILKKAQVAEMAVRSEIGRALQATRMMVEGVDNRLRIMFNKINKSGKYSPFEKQAMIENIAKLDLSDNKTFLKELDKISPSDWFEKFAEWSVAAKLWNPTTHAVNFAGNTGRGLADVAIKTATNPMAAKADMMGAVKGLKQGVRNFAKAWTDDHYAAQLSKYVEAGGTSQAIKGTFGKIVRTPFRALGASDEIFKSVAFQRKMYRDAYKIAKKEKLKGTQLEARMNEILNAPSFKMQKDATEEAKRMTFQEDLGDFMKSIDKLRNPSAFKRRDQKFAATAFRMFLPFLKTPTNLFKQSIDFSPFGLAKNAIKLKRAIKNKDAETAGTIIGEALLGTAIVAYIASEAAEGNVTGGAPRGTSAKDAFYREKKLPYAIKIGDTWYQYKRVDPFASTIGLTTDIMALEDKTKVGAIAGVIAENLKDKTYLSGMSDFMKVLTGEDWEREYAFKSMVLGGTLPSFIGHTARSMDPTIRRVDTWEERLKATMPVVSEGLPARVNVLGYDAERANKGLNYFFNPIQSADAEIDYVTQELMEINTTLAVPDKTFSRNNVDYEFGPDEYEEYASTVGHELNIELSKLFSSDFYQRKDADEKIKLIKKKRDKIMKDYKDEFVKNKKSGTSTSAGMTDAEKAQKLRDELGM